MKVLLDECVDVRFRHAITGHSVFTVTYMGWNGVKERCAPSAGDRGGI
jgi:hypothetical protein